MSEDPKEARQAFEKTLVYTYKSSMIPKLLFSSLEEDLKEYSKNMKSKFQEKVFADGINDLKKLNPGPMENYFCLLDLHNHKPIWYDANSIADAGNRKKSYRITIGKNFDPTNSRGNIAFNNLIQMDKRQIKKKKGSMHEFNRNCTAYQPNGLFLEHSIFYNTCLRTIEGIRMYQQAILLKYDLDDFEDYVLDLEEKNQDLSFIPDKETFISLQEGAAKLRMHLLKERDDARKNIKKRMKDFEKFADDVLRYTSRKIARDAYDDSVSYETFIKILAMFTRILLKLVNSAKKELNRITDEMRKKISTKLENLFLFKPEELEKFNRGFIESNKITK